MKKRKKQHERDCRSCGKIGNNALNTLGFVVLGNKRDKNSTAVDGARKRRRSSGKQDCKWIGNDKQAGFRNIVFKQKWNQNTQRQQLLWPALKAEAYNSRDDGEQDGETGGDGAIARKSQLESKAIGQESDHIYH
jgi:V8-like Glu-specific endopeptidase